MSLLQKYVSDVRNDGNYTLALGHRDTMTLWEEIDELARKLTSNALAAFNRESDQAKRIDELERENARLQRAIDERETADFLKRCGDHMEKVREQAP